MKTLKRGPRSLLIHPALLGLLLLGLPGLGNFSGTTDVSPTTEFEGHLAEAGTSDNWVTGWTYARYYGPPAKNTYGITAGWPHSGGTDIREEYAWATRTYISTGALFDSATYDLGYSNVETELPWYVAYAVID